MYIHTYTEKCPMATNRILFLTTILSGYLGDSNVRIYTFIFTRAKYIQIILKQSERNIDTYSFMRVSRILF